jgi:hypothetical protein
VGGSRAAAAARLVIISIVDQSIPSFFGTATNSTCYILAIFITEFAMDWALAGLAMDWVTHSVFRSESSLLFEYSFVLQSHTSIANLWMMTLIIYSLHN